MYRQDDIKWQAVLEEDDTVTFKGTYNVCSEVHHHSHQDFMSNGGTSRKDIRKTIKEIIYGELLQDLKNAREYIPASHEAAVKIDKILERIKSCNS